MNSCSKIEDSILELKGFIFIQVFVYCSVVLVLALNVPMERIMDLDFESIKLLIFTFDIFTFFFLNWVTDGSLSPLFPLTLLTLYVAC